MIRLRCVGGKHGMPFTREKVYDVDNIDMKTQHVSLYNDSSNIVTAKYTVSQSGNIRVASGVFRINYRVGEW